VLRAKVAEQFARSATHWGLEEIVLKGGLLEEVVFPWTMEELKHFPMHGHGLRRFRDSQNVLKKALLEEGEGKARIGRTGNVLPEKFTHAQSTTCLSPSTKVCDTYQPSHIQILTARLV
jgi:hypothetical protein